MSDFQLLRWTSLLLLAGTQAYGATFTFAATVSSANIGTFVTGQTIQGSLTYDSATPGLPQSDGTLSYTGAITDFQLGGIHLTGSLNQNVINILPFSVSGYTDVFDAKIGTATSTLEFYLSAFKNTGTLGTGGLPSMAPSLTDFQDPGASPLTYVQLADYSIGFEHIDANLTSLAVAAPEPGTLALAGVCLLGLSTTLRRRRRDTSTHSTREGKPA